MSLIVSSNAHRPAMLTRPNPIRHRIPIRADLKTPREKTFQVVAEVDARMEPNNAALPNQCAARVHVRLCEEHERNDETRKTRSGNRGPAPSRSVATITATEARMRDPLGELRKQAKADSPRKSAPQFTK